MKPTREWFIDVPWGKIALISWGSPMGESVLLVHGRQDSAISFLPLIRLLGNSFRYVALDLPGHGKSDQWPTGVVVSRFHFVPAVDMVVRHLGWQSFIYIAHSMGTELGLFYNAIYPQQIKKFIFLDPMPALQMLHVTDPGECMRLFYHAYYDDYERYNRDDRVYTERKAVDSVMRNRKVNEEQARLLLSRNLNKIGEDQYRLSWDRRLKILAPTNYSVQYYAQLFSNLPPTLILSASEQNVLYKKGKDGAEQLLKEMRERNIEVAVKTVEGGHDVHFTNPERLAKDVFTFLMKNLDRAKL